MKALQSYIKKIEFLKTRQFSHTFQLEYYPLEAGVKIKVNNLYIFKKKKIRATNTENFIKNG